MWWNEEQDIIEIIQRGQGAHARCRRSSKPRSNADNDVLVEAGSRYFRVYEHTLSTAGAIDFASTWCRWSPTLLTSNGSYRRAITSAYDHVLVDEYQDVNPGQITLIDHFVNDGVGLWAVGDELIRPLYSFRASDIRHILEFTARYPAAATHVAQSQLSLGIRNRAGS